MRQSPKEASESFLVTSKTILSKVISHDIIDKNPSLVMGWATIYQLFLQIIFKSFFNMPYGV